MEDLTAILAVVYAVAQIGLLTGIFFRLGKGQARFEELFRRVCDLEVNLKSRRTDNEKFLGK